MLYFLLLSCNVIANGRRLARNSIVLKILPAMTGQIFSTISILVRLP
jgi:hypothetical protein